MLNFYKQGAEREGQLPQGLTVVIANHINVFKCVFFQGSVWFCISYTMISGQIIITKTFILCFITTSNHNTLILFEGGLCFSQACGTWLFI